MKGIYFEEIFRNLLLVLLIIYTLISIIDFLYKKVLLVRRERKPIQDKRKKIRTGTNAIVTIIAIFLVIYALEKNENIIVCAILLICSIIILGIAYAVAFYEFIQYIFLKPFDYQLNESREYSLWVVGTCVYTANEMIAMDEIREKMESWVNSVEGHYADIIKMILLPIWYFAIFFFLIVFLVCSLHKIVVWIKVVPRNVKRNEVRPDKESKRNEKKLLSDQIWNEIESKAKRGSLKNKISYWAICIALGIILLGESLIELTGNVGWLIWKTIKLIIYFPLSSIGNGIIYLITLLEKEQGKAIVVGSRMALVFSLLIVFVIDNYDHIFSRDGSSVFEFLCSVIIIPFLISQLDEIKNQKKKKVSYNEKSCGTDRMN